MRVLLAVTAAAVFAFACSNAGDPCLNEDATGFACSNQHCFKDPFPEYH